VKTAPFDYVAPPTLEGVLAVLEERGDDARVIAGGQSLVPLMAFRVADPALLVDLRRVDALCAWSENEGSVVAGAMVTQAMAQTLPAIHPLVREAIPLIAHPQIRNRGTLGGSFAHADPAAELPAVAVALQAEIHVAGPAGERSIPAEDFFRTYFTTALEPGEVLTGVRFPVSRAGEGSAILEVSRRPGDFALAGVAVRVAIGSGGEVTDAAVVPFAVGDRPIRSPGAAAELVGVAPEPERVASAAQAVAAEVDPPSDMHAGAAYRRHAVGVLAERALGTALERAAVSRGR
jgi:carbon-monoxide dehydrogenase medium subunit